MNYEVIRLITDSVKLVKYENSLFVLKNFKTHELKNATINYIDKLKANNLPTLLYINDIPDSNELFIEYINKALTYDKHNKSEYIPMIAEQLKAIHSIGVVHGTFENSNILIGDNEIYFINPDLMGEKEDDLVKFIKNNYPMCRVFESSLNKQDFNQNASYDLFISKYTSNELFRIKYFIVNLRAKK